MTPITLDELCIDIGTMHSFRIETASNGKIDITVGVWDEGGYDKDYRDTVNTLEAVRARFEAETWPDDTDKAEFEAWVTAAKAFDLAGGNLIWGKGESLGDSVMEYARSAIRCQPTQDTWGEVRTPVVPSRPENNGQPLQWGDVLPVGVEQPK